MEYKNTIITPKTAFPMKAGLPNREPGMLEAWNDMDLYGQLLEKNRTAPGSFSTTALPSPTETFTWATPSTRR